MSSSNDKVRPLHEQDPNTQFDVPADQLERIIARASVLQHTVGDGSGTRLSEEEIIAIGREVRLDPDFVRQALSEYRADALVPPAPADHPWMKRLFGPAHARVRRVIPGEPANVHQKFERQMRSEERMRPVRLRASESVWEPDSSWLGKISRALDLEGRGYELSQLKSISIATAPASADQTMVTLTADLAEERKELLTGWGIALACLVVFAVAPLLFTKVWLWLLLGPAVVGAAVLAGSFVLASMNSKRRRAALLLEGLLDQLEMPRR